MNLTIPGYTVKDVAALSYWVLNDFQLVCGLKFYQAEKVIKKIKWNNRK